MKFKFKKYIAIITLSLSVPTFAANMSGYAWSESLGWFDFSNATVSNTAVTGYAYNDNTGWLVLDGVVNTNGVLSGYAWSESVGYFDFSRVTLSNGALSGFAYNDNTGWLSFATGTSVTTTWTLPVPMPAVTPSYSGGGSSGGGSSYVPASLLAPKTEPTVNTPTKIPSTVPSSAVMLVNTQKNLKVNMIAPEVKNLQQFLNSQGFIVSKKGLGSLGLESTFFGNQTKQALIRFQIKNNIRPASGYFGPLTKAFIKTLKIN